MGFWLDIYVATKDRSRACIEQFLKEYVDVEVENTRQDFEIRLHNTQESLDTETLQSSIEIGLANPDYSFTLYLTPKHQNTKSSILHFGQKGILIVGLSIEEETESGYNESEAQRLLAVLKDIFNTGSGIIVWETPPAELEKNLQSY